MITLSLDPGTTTGYAKWRDGKLIQSGTLKINWKDPQGLDKYLIALRQLLTDVGEAFCEKEYTFFPAMRSKVFLSRYHKAFAALQTTLSLLGIPTLFVDTRKMAKKKRAQEIVRMMLGEKRNRSTHECEAILLGMKEQGLQTLVVKK